MDQRDDSRRIDDRNAEDRDDHPVGTGTGTGAGATAGAVAGAAVAGPPGAVVGGVVGGIAGGAAGHGVADAVNPEGDEVSGDRVPDPGTGDEDTIGRD
ncbi:MAG TPA: hypothetical protein VM242_03865 [Acidimicrobiales bacterium]|jgi:phage tail tape-measure protein|nr:hypothetical protein [Acidimicrobiales bacterium]